jgi:hypothetical protein
MNAEALTSSLESSKGDDHARWGALAQVDTLHPDGRITRKCNRCKANKDRDAEYVKDDSRIGRRMYTCKRCYSDLRKTTAIVEAPTVRPSPPVMVHRCRTCQSCRGTDERGCCVNCGRMPRGEPCSSF